MSRRQGAAILKCGLSQLERPALLTVGIAVVCLSVRGGGVSPQTNESVDSNYLDERRPGDSFY
jgi:hypothetical protein